MATMARSSRRKIAADAIVTCRSKKAMSLSSSRLFPVRTEVSIPVGAVVSLSRKKAASPWSSEYPEWFQSHETFFPFQIQGSRVQSGDQRLTLRSNERCEESIDW